MRFIDIMYFLYYIELIGCIYFLGALYKFYNHKVYIHYYIIRLRNNTRACAQVSASVVLQGYTPAFAVRNALAVKKVTCPLRFEVNGDGVRPTEMNYYADGGAGGDWDVDEMETADGLACVWRGTLKEFDLHTRLALRIQVDT